MHALSLCPSKRIQNSHFSFLCALVCVCTQTILERLDADEIVIGDGGFVFALEKRGYVKAGPWTPEAAAEHPESGKGGRACSGTKSKTPHCAHNCLVLTPCALRCSAPAAS